MRAPSTGASHSSAAGGIVIPDHWRPEVESCIAAKYLSDNARAEIKRTLVSQLFAKSSRPNRSDCDQIARKLILKYPFMKDNLGNGYVSHHVYYMYLGNLSRNSYYNVSLPLASWKHLKLLPITFFCL